jgi:hypothetical protein
MGRAAHIAHKPNVVRVGESRDAGSQIKIRAEAASVAKNIERKVATRDAH